MHQTVSGSESESQQEADHRIDQEHMHDINRVHHQYLGYHIFGIRRFHSISRLNLANDICVFQFRFPGRIYIVLGKDTTRGCAAVA